MNAPHLPPKSCRMKTHYAMQSLPWLFVVIIISALTSVVIALTVLVWLAPAFSSGQYIAVTPRRQIGIEKELNAAVVNKIRSRLWAVYDTKQKIGKTYYRADSSLFTAAVFSSDGWAVAYSPNVESNGVKAWEAVDYQGIIAPIERVVRDPVSSLIYLKLTGDGFPFANFAGDDALERGETFWVYNRGEWKSGVADRTASAPDKPYEIWKQARKFVFPAGDAGDVLIDERGELAGAIGDEKKVIPFWLAREQYAGILDQAKTSWTAFPWRGFMVDGAVAADGGSRRVSGFYVQTSPTRAASSTVGAGDVIAAIGGRPVTDESLWRQALSAPDPAGITVLRNGKEAEVKVRKVQIE